MIQAPLQLHLEVPPGREPEAAQVCRARMTAAGWEALCRFAAAVVLAQEEASTGQVVVVAPVSREHLAAVVAAR